MTRKPVTSKIAMFYPDWVKKFYFKNVVTWLEIDWMKDERRWNVPLPQEWMSLLIDRKLKSRFLFSLTISTVKLHYSKFTLIFSVIRIVLFLKGALTFRHKQTIEMHLACVLNWTTLCTMINYFWGLQWCQQYKQCLEHKTIGVKDRTWLRLHHHLRILTSQFSKPYYKSSMIRPLSLLHFNLFWKSISA